MAKKKVTSQAKGINLLKGITGSKLAKMIAIIVVILAIPLTITSLKQQTNTQQEAASNPCGSPCYTYVKATDSCKYKCTASQKCTASGCTSATTTTKRTCSSENGTCLNLNQYWCNVTISGLCPGGSNVKCCVGNFGKK